MWLALVAAAIVAGACTSPVSSPPSTASANQAGSVGLGRQPSRDPADLPVYSEEAAVIEAIASAGFHVDRIGPSKFEEYIFGERKRARVFGAPVESTRRDRIRVEILFPDAPVGEVRVCPSSSAGPNEYSISIAGREISVGSTQPLFFAISDRFFVMASNEPVRDALRARLGLSIPPC
jgi:hypothetical protein